MWPFDSNPRYTFEGPWKWDKPGYEKALANFRAVHGCEPDPLMNAFVIYHDYRGLSGQRKILAAPLDQLPSITADLTQRLDAAKAKHGIA